MMYRNLLLCALLAYCGAVPLPEDAQATVIKYENTNDGHGNYKFSYETSNGITREESGQLVNVGLPDEHMVVQGDYSYIDTNGERITVHYTADQNGYHVNEPTVDFPPLTSIAFGGVSPNVVASLLGK